MTTEEDGIIIPSVRIYDPRRAGYLTLENVHLDSDYVRDAEGRVMYFDVAEARAYLAERGKSLASLPLLVNIYIALAPMAEESQAAARLLGQLNSAWDRTGTTISPAGRIVHDDSVMGEVVHEGLHVPQQGGDLAELYGAHEKFFQALLGLRDIAELTEAAARANSTPFYWCPRGERRVMFGGGDFYYMHQHLPGLLMVFCDDEPHPRRVLRGVWQG